MLRSNENHTASTKKTKTKKTEAKNIDKAVEKIIEYYENDEVEISLNDEVSLKGQQSAFEIAQNIPGIPTKTLALLGNGMKRKKSKQQIIEDNKQNSIKEKQSKSEIHGEASKYIIDQICLICDTEFGLKSEAVKHVTDCHEDIILEVLRDPNHPMNQIVD